MPASVYVKSQKNDAADAEAICEGGGGEIATNRLENQEATVLRLHLLQNCMVFVNTLMIQTGPSAST